MRRPRMSVNERFKLFLPAMRPVTGVGAGAVGRIPADSGDDVLDAVVVRRRVHRRGAVAGAVAGGAGAVAVCRMVAR